ncbi:SAM-dependent methyltransferase [Flammeovirga yaeyamensis]|uniref:SAM-dependent methyltransferase n=1 Tax=Flammeovirga yaeyamensis TaxID=367791 RepID=A0AAX1N225_9BACT|nr:MULTISPECIES: SAM-dependent methyltransferase [Flammeovirga]ANQ51061.1 SAM-dependent methyltransferase [Flammeovirga sp. MY04]MBB3698088.1 16S rRNA (cytidine1402-2'-O)-methyltransferase [Flammeovirga yaeyamensis]NMF34553.1 SAM-dependent methyltransferase [Flammeovirga yaeyamensis]QWG01530.1 SAM-dependent methyltransferase [Flammeovirga yaeyamensis]
MKLFLIPSLLAADSYDSLPIETKEAVRTTKYYLVEDLRTARRFIGGWKIEGIVVQDLNFQILDKKTKPEKVQELFKNIPKGENVGVVSEAGCPGIADPGALAVQYAHKNNIQVKPLVGPSSILLALMASGLSGQKFAFHGYLPIKKAEKQKALKNLEKDSSKLYQAQIFMETPFRNTAMLEDLCQNLNGDTKLCIAANINAEDEYIKTMTIKQWKKAKVDIHKKPCIFIIQS